MEGIIGIVVIILVILYFVSNLTSDNKSSSVSTPSHAILYTDLNTRKTFTVYIIGSILNNGCIYNTHFNLDEGLYWAKGLIDQAFDQITTGSCLSYQQRGCFNLYEGQTLTPENRVYMDLFEKLIWGDNCNTKNRVSELPSDVQNKMRISLYTLHGFLTENGPDMREKKAEGAVNYDNIFNEIGQ